MICPCWLLKKELPPCIDPLTRYIREDSPEARKYHFTLYSHNEVFDLCAYTPLLCGAIYGPGTWSGYRDIYEQTKDGSTSLKPEDYCSWCVKAYEEGEKACPVPVCL